MSHLQEQNHAHDLAEILVQYGRMYDLYEYKDTVDDPEQATTEIEAKLAKGEVEPFIASLEQDIEELSDAYGLHVAAELTLMLLREYQKRISPSQSLDQKITQAKVEAKHPTLEPNLKFEPERS